MFTDNFGSLAKFVAESQGLPGLPIAFVEHPLTNTPAEAARERANRARLIDEIIAALSTPAAELDAAYRPRAYAAARDAGVSTSATV